MKSKAASSQSAGTLSESEGASLESEAAPSKSKGALSESEDAVSESKGAPSLFEDAASQSEDAPSKSNFATKEPIFQPLKAKLPFNMWVGTALRRVPEKARDVRPSGNATPRTRPLVPWGRKQNLRSGGSWAAYAERVFWMRHVLGPDQGARGSAPLPFFTEDGQTDCHSAQSNFACSNTVCVAFSCLSGG